MTLVERLRESASSEYIAAGSNSLNVGVDPIACLLEAADYIENLDRQMAELVAIETALRNKISVSVLVKCPKCSTEMCMTEPVTQFDCLGCGSRIVSEERQKPILRSVSSEDASR